MDKKVKRDDTYFIEDTLFHLSGWLKRLWIFILIFAVIGASGAVAYTYYTYTPMYSASATFTVNVDVKESSAERYNKATANQLQKTFPSILTSSSLNKIICNDLGVSSLNDTINASVIEDTNLFTITVTSANAQQAHNVLQSVINNYPEIARFIIGSTQLSLIDTSSVSTKPINFPDYKQKAIIGMLAGAMVAIMVIILLSLTTSTVIRSSDITSSFSIKCLCSVPELIKKKRSNTDYDDTPNIESKNINYKFRESIFTLRNSVIRTCKEKGYKSIVITSSISGEGKSVISMNLAQALAIKGYKTVFVDYDLRSPSAYTYLHIEDEFTSVSEYLRGHCSTSDCVNKTSIDNLYIALEKNNNPDAIELLGSKKSQEFINSLSNEFEFVIIDSAPAGYLADASVIADYADAAIYVIAQDIVSKNGIKDGLSSFDNLNAKVIGAVLNRITKGAESLTYGKYGYRRYGYSYSSRYYGKYSSNKYDKYSSVHSADITIMDNNAVLEEKDKEV